MGGSVRSGRPDARASPVTSTSPGPAPAAGGQVPRSPTLDTHFGPYGSVHHHPASIPAWSRRTQLNLQLNFVGPSSTTDRDVPAFVADPSDDYHEELSQFNWYTPDAGTISPDRRLRHIYVHRVASRPGSGIVNVAVGVWRIAGLCRSVDRWAFTTARTRIRVIPQAMVRSTSSTASTRPVVPGYSLLTWIAGATSSARSCFGIKQVRIRRVRDRFTVTRTGRSAWCVSSPCEQPVLSTISQANLTALTGTLHPDRYLEPDVRPDVHRTTFRDKDRLSTLRARGQPVPTSRSFTPQKRTRPARLESRILTSRQLRDLLAVSRSLRQDVEVTLQPISCDLIAAPSVSSCKLRRG